jgi:hypothetical protein
MSLAGATSRYENCLYSKDFFDKGAVHTYDARLC